MKSLGEDLPPAIVIPTNNGQFGLNSPQSNSHKQQHHRKSQHQHQHHLQQQQQAQAAATAALNHQYSMQSKTFKIKI
jgi:hypothetical protein